MLLLLIYLLLGREPDETLAAYVPEGATYRLETLDGRPVTTAITLDPSVAGRLSGQAPCNRYHAAQTAPYPWLDVGEITATRRACPKLALERTYLDALAAMTLAEAGGDILILSNPAGRELVFQRLP